MKKDNKKALYESIMTSVAREVKKVLNEDFNDGPTHPEWYRYCYNALQQAAYNGLIGPHDDICRRQTLYALMEEVLAHLNGMPDTPDELTDEEYNELKYHLVIAFRHIDFGDGSLIDDDDDF